MKVLIKFHMNGSQSPFFLWTLQKGSFSKRYGKAQNVALDDEGASSV